MHADEPARILAGRYRLGPIIGRGGMGAVWRARDELLNRDVAAKELIWPPHLDNAEREIARLRAVREAQMAARLNHPNVVGIYDIVEEDERPWIIMELLPYRSLRDIVREDGPLTPVQTAQVGLGILDALSAAHAEGILHRDVKPGNILVESPDRVVLTDFGIARATDSPTLTGTGILIGSPSYIAPERARGELASAAGDLWALGASLYTAVEGRPPFDRNGALPTMTAVVADEPDPAHRAGPLWPVISGLLRKDPAERLDAAETERMLRHVVADGEHDVADGERAVAAGAGAAVPRPQAPVQEAAPEPTAAPAAGGEAATAAPAAPLLPAEPEPKPKPKPVVAAAAAARPGRSRRPGMRAALAALIVVAAAGTAIAFLPDGPGGHKAATRSQARPDPSARPAATGPAQASALPPASRSPSAGPSGSPSAGPSRPVAARPSRSAAAGPSGSPAISAPPGPASGYGALPAGFYRFTNSTGFSIGVPGAWQISHVGHYVYITDPADSGIFLLIDQSDQPKPDPLADWEQQQANRESSYPAYHLIRLQSVTYPQAEKAADWEFTYDRGGIPVHVLNRNILANAHHAYALYWSTPQNSWSTDYHYFQAFAATFRPAP